jgi:hypothetical protein
MNLDKLKDKLDGETLAELQAHIADLTGQRDAARQESIQGRKGLKAELEAARATAARALEKLGVESADELDSLPDGKGQAEALRQLEARIKRAERERDEARQTAEKATTLHRTSLQRAAIADAMGGHEFIARDIVETYVSQRLAWEGEELLFKDDGGKLIPLKDGVATIAKTRPELLKPQGTGGAGVRQGNAGSGAGATKTMTRAEFEALPPAQRVEQAKAGVQLT